MKDLEKQLLELFHRDRLAGLATVTPDGRPWVRYVTLLAKTGFPLVFCTDVHSRKMAHIRANPEVHLTSGNLEPPDDSVYLQIQGRAEVSTDPSARSRYWKKEWTRYFKGPDDPNYVIVEVAPYRIELYGPHGFEPLVWTGS